MKIDFETYQYFERMVGMAASEECSCGGRGPFDPGVCQACMVYHHLFSGVPGKLMGNRMNIGKPKEET